MRTKFLQEIGGRGIFAHFWHKEPMDYGPVNRLKSKLLKRVGANDRLCSFLELFADVD
jgi:hypothetical protein